MVTKLEWERIKGTHGNCCVICGKSEKVVGILEQAHLKARSKGGTQVVPMCPTHHAMYDKGLLTSTQQKKLGITDEKTYKKMIPARNASDNRPATTARLNKLSIVQLKTLATSHKIRLRSKSAWSLLDGSYTIPPTKKEYVTKLSGVIKEKEVRTLLK